MFKSRSNPRFDNEGRGLEHKGVCMCVFFFFNLLVNRYLIRNITPIINLIGGSTNILFSWYIKKIFFCISNLEKTSGKVKHLRI